MALSLEEDLNYFKVKMTPLCSHLLLLKSFEDITRQPRVRVAEDSVPFLVLIFTSLVVQSHQYVPQCINLIMMKPSIVAIHIMQYLGQPYPLFCQCCLVLVPTFGTQTRESVTTPLISADR